jgi:hypothetical protein
MGRRGGKGGGMSPAAIGTHTLLLPRHEMYHALPNPSDPSVREHCTHPRSHDFWPTANNSTTQHTTRRRAHGTHHAPSHRLPVNGTTWSPVMDVCSTPST